MTQKTDLSGPQLGTQSETNDAIAPVWSPMGEWEKEAAGTCLHPGNPGAGRVSPILVNTHPHSVLLNEASLCSRI